MLGRNMKARQMGTGHNFEKFKAAILKLSNAPDWLEAKPEWELHGVYWDGAERRCECGHQPIHQICVIQNRDNRNEAEVGNVCVHNFMQLASRRIFAVIKRVQAEVTKSFNPAALDLFVRRKVISHDEKADYETYWRKRTNLSKAQSDQKLDINKRILVFVEAESERLRKKFADLGIKPREPG